MHKENTMESELSLDQWPRISRVLDFIQSQRKEESGMYSIKEKPPKPQHKPKKPKDQRAEQLRLF
jgi:hypothetical protein